MKYKKLLENISDWIWEVNEDGVYTYCSDSVYSFLGYKAKEVLGKTPFDFMCEDEALRVKTLFQTHASEKSPIIDFFNKHTHKDGHEVIVKTNAIPILDEYGDTVGYIGIDKDVSKEQQLEFELKNKRKNIADLTALIDNSDTIVFHWKAQEHWPVKYVSKNISMFGYTQEDFLSGKVSYHSIIHPDDSIQVEKEVAEYSQNHTNNFSQVYRIMTASGEVRWIDDRTVIQRDSGDNIVYYIGTIIDITKRKTAQLQLQESEEKFRKISENALMGIFIYQEKFVYANEAFSNITGYTKDELYSMKAWEILDPSHKEAIEDTIQKRLSGIDFPVNYSDMTIIKKSGQRRILRISTQTIRHENRYSGMGTVVDITDIIETKKQLQLLSQVVEQTDAMIIITNKDGTIIYVNDALVAHTGYKHIEFIGQKSNILNSGKHDEKFYQNMWRTILDGKIYRNTLINKKKDSQLYYEEITITPIMDAEQKIQNFVSTSQDITEQFKMQEKLNKLATIDSLTNIYNRHKISEIIDVEISEVLRYNTSFSLAMIDIDHFKLVNDRHGHDIGDYVLKEFADLVSSLIRISDSFGRWGGEEFMLILPHTDKAQSLTITQKLIDKVANHKFENIEQITISMGITLYVHNEEKESLIKRVDEALYEAKNSGRNRVVLK